MRRFRFRLDSLLRVRSQVERTARKALAIAMAEVHTFDQQLEAASRGLADCEAQAARADSVGHLARGLEDGLRRHRWRLTRQREQAEQRLEAVRVDYTEKARELKTMQRLRDQEHERWRTETLRQEQAELDELAVLTRSGAPGDESW